MMLRISNTITSFLYQDLKRSTAYFLAAIFSGVYVLNLYPMHFLLGNAGFFEGEDIAQHVSGWLAYADDDWHWPIFFTSRISYPDGISIAFTDSIPLVAVLVKPFVDFLPENFHYFGLWQGFAFFFQGMAALFLIRALGVRHILGLMAALVFALTWPSLIWRLAHTSLMTHALILTALGVYFYGMSGCLSFKKATVSFFVLCILALLIHPYFIPPCFLVFLAYLFDDSLKAGRWRSNLPWAIVLALLIVFLGKVLGYLGGSTADGGFGQFSLNLAAPFCGGRFTPCFKDATGGQGEGFNYLGIGFLVLAISGSVVYRKKAVLMVKQYPALFFISSALFLYALSNKIYFQEHLLVEYPLPRFAMSLVSTFRASGRFFWVVGYLLLFTVISLWLREKHRYVPLVMAVAVMMQLADVQPLRANFIGATDRPGTVEDKKWQTILADVDQISIYPIFGCAAAPSDIYLQYQLMATRHKKLLNTAYIARSTPNCDEKSREFEESLAGRTLYVLPMEYLKKPPFMLPAGFLEALRQEKCVQQGMALLCRSNYSRSVWKLIGLEDAVPAYQFQHTSYRWPASDLPTSIGMVNGELLLAKEGNAGYLSFGPYTMLSAGAYKISIRYTSENEDSENPNIWDIVSNKSGTSREFAKGIFAVNAGKEGKAIGIIRLDHPTEGIEIRSFYQGKGKFQIDDIVVEKI
jgi:hypothetical protein